MAQNRYFDVLQQLRELAERNVARELTNAKDMQDVLAIQSRYAQIRMQAYALQAQELGNLMARASQNMRPWT